MIPCFVKSAFLMLGYRVYKARHLWNSSDPKIFCFKVVHRPVLLSIQIYVISNFMGYARLIHAVKTDPIMFPNQP